jgi:DNA-directed RNA polymerase specialized sigma24 family protein
MLQGRLSRRRSRRLVEGCLAADRRAFDAVFERYFRRVHRLAAARARSREELEKLCEEAMTAVLAGIEAARGARSLDDWVLWQARRVLGVVAPRAPGPGRA